MTSAALFAVVVGAVTGRASALAIDLERAGRYFAEVSHISARDNGKLWGIKLGGPMLFVDRATLEAVANQPDREGRLTARDSMWVGKHPESIAPANTAIEWAGVRWTMVMWPVPELPQSRARLLMHECFHRVQPELLLPALSPMNAHLDGVEGRIWMRLEMRALAAALSSAGAERQRAVSDALSFRAERKRLCGDAAAEEERQLEINEGLCEYTGFKLAGYGPPSLDARAAVFLEQSQASQSFARSFAYATGPAYGLLLDAFKPGWRGALNGSSSLSDLLSSSLRSHSERIPLEERAERYGGIDLVAGERQLDSRRKERIAGFQKVFVEGPNLSLPVLSEFSYSYDPNAVVSFPGMGQVLQSAKISDEWGVLQVSGGQVLLKRGPSGITAIVLSAATPAFDPQGPKGDGWTLTLRPGWKLEKGGRPEDFVVRKG
jgi:hypothetical protein